MRVERVEVGPLQVNCWIVSDAAGGPAVVIDPGDDSALILSALDGLDVTAIVLTHCHFDHLGAAGAVKDATDAPILAHEADADFLTDPQGTGGAMFGFTEHVAPPADRRLHAGDTIEAGALSMRVLHTPGHTPGGISLFVEGCEGDPPHLFSGDTLFAGSVGRTDFPRGDSPELMRSIADALAGLPEATIVHPGHGPESTIARERRLNPFWPRA